MVLLSVAPSYIMSSDIESESEPAVVLSALESGAAREESLDSSSVLSAPGALDNGSEYQDEPNMSDDDSGSIPNDAAVHEASSSDDVDSVAVQDESCRKDKIIENMSDDPFLWTKCQPADAQTVVELSPPEILTPRKQDAREKVEVQVTGLKVRVLEPGVKLYKGVGMKTPEGIVGYEGNSQRWFGSRSVAEGYGNVLEFTPKRPLVLFDLRDRDNGLAMIAILNKLTMQDMAGKFEKVADSYDSNRKAIAEYETESEFEGRGGDMFTGDYISDDSFSRNMVAQNFETVIGRPSEQMESEYYPMNIKPGEALKRYSVYNTDFFVFKGVCTALEKAGIAVDGYYMNRDPDPSSGGSMFQKPLVGGEIMVCRGNDVVHTAEDAMKWTLAGEERARLSNQADEEYERKRMMLEMFKENLMSKEKFEEMGGIVPPQPSQVQPIKFGLRRPAKRIEGPALATAPGNQ